MTPWFPRGNRHRYRRSISGMPARVANLSSPIPDAPPSPLAGPPDPHRSPPVYAHPEVYTGYLTDGRHVLMLVIPHGQVYDITVNPGRVLAGHDFPQGDESKRLTFLYVDGAMSTRHREDHEIRGIDSIMPELQLFCR